MQKVKKKNVSMRKLYKEERWLRTMERRKLEGVGSYKLCSDTAPVAAADHRDPRFVAVIAVQGWVLPAALQLQGSLLLGFKGRGHWRGSLSREGWDREKGEAKGKRTRRGGGKERWRGRVEQRTKREKYKGRDGRRNREREGIVGL